MSTASTMKARGTVSTPPHQHPAAVVRVPVACGVGAVRCRALAFGAYHFLGCVDGGVQPATPVAHARALAQRGGVDMFVVHADLLRGRGAVVRVEPSGRLAGQANPTNTVVVPVDGAPVENRPGAVLQFDGHPVMATVLAAHDRQRPQPVQPQALPQRRGKAFEQPRRRCFPGGRSRRSRSASSCAARCRRSPTVMAMAAQTSRSRRGCHRRGVPGHAKARPGAARGGFPEPEAPPSSMASAPWSRPAEEAGEHQHKGRRAVGLGRTTTARESPSRSPRRPWRWPTAGTGRIVGKRHGRARTPRAPAPLAWRQRAQAGPVGRRPDAQACAYGRPCHAQWRHAASTLQAS